MNSEKKELGESYQMMTDLGLVEDYLRGGHKPLARRIIEKELVKRGFSPRHLDNGVLEQLYAKYKATAGACYAFTASEIAKEAFADELRLWDHAQKYWQAKILLGFLGLGMAFVMSCILIKEGESKLLENFLEFVSGILFLVVGIVFLAEGFQQFMMQRTKEESPYRTMERSRYRRD